MTLLITGGAGYLGRRVAALALQSWSQVAVSVHRQPVTRHDLTALAIDLTQADAVVAALDALNPQAIIHTAAVTPAMGAAMTPEALWAVNVLGSATLARWAHIHGCRLVHVSSDAIWGGREHDYTEHDVPSPITPYGASKAAAEALVATLCPSAALARTSLIYGHTPPDPNTLMAQEFSTGARKGALFTDEIRCPVFVDDLALALLELSQRDDAGPFHLVGSQALSRYEFGTALVRWAGGDPTSIPATTTQASGLRRPSRVVLRNDHTQAMLKTPLRGVAEVTQKEVYGGRYT